MFKERAEAQFPWEEVAKPAAEARYIWLRNWERLHPLMFPGILAGNSLAQSRSTGEVVPAAPGQQPRCAACSSPSPPAWLTFLAGWPWQHDPGLGAAAALGAARVCPSRSTRWCCKTALLPALHSAGAGPAGRCCPCSPPRPGPGTATEGQLGPSPRQAGWRVTRGGTCHQLCPRAGPTSGLDVLLLVPAQSWDEVLAPP